eukprot:1137433-Pelagomonas_calceolata.AAC.10
MSALHCIFSMSIAALMDIGATASCSKSSSSRCSRTQPLLFTFYTSEGGDQGEQTIPKEAEDEIKEAVGQVYKMSDDPYW